MTTDKGTLYVVATPIGNLSEMTPRAITIMQQASLIACEDTRETLKLCTHFSISTPLMSCHEHNEMMAKDSIMEALQNGRDVALVSDAGYPGISDPGLLVIQKAISLQLKVVVISGPCAIINGLVGSGLDTDHFYFHGFLPVRRGDKRKELETLGLRRETLIFYEAPHRIEETLEDIHQVLGNRQACIARELTKKFEEYLRGTVEELRNLVFTTPLRGELVVLIEGKENEERITVSNVDIIESVNKLLEEGMTTKDAIRSVAERFGLKKNEVYRLFHQ